ncbi:MAG TPA: type I restriction enzyme HsdR N-terminal domain-containing protein [Thermodesulfobacteriota bacterium]|nr:type I restriction enzyme HsdR N-terminal domain-containing protein [Thermodesulfobacteriota bacterium]
MPDTCPGDRFKEGLISPSACETIKEEVIRKKTFDLLLDKGYLAEDLSEEEPFALETGQEVFQLRVSFLIKLRDHYSVLIKCAAGSVLARERPTLALARLFTDYQIPLTIVTNGDDALFLDTLTGETLGCGLSEIPDKTNLLSRYDSMKFLPLSEKRVPLEKRILSAFEALGLHGECH